MKALISAAVLLLAAIPVGATEAAPTVVIHIHDFSYDPDTVTVAPGATIEWDNDDSARHTVTADNGAFDSGDIKAGQKWTHAFPTAGTFTYSCTQHPDMTATITVK